MAQLYQKINGEAVPVGGSNAKSFDIHALEESKTSIVDNDEFALADIEDSNKTKKITWSNIKSVLANLFLRKDQLITDIGASNINTNAPGAAAVKDWSNTSITRLVWDSMLEGENTIGTWVDNEDPEDWDTSDWLKDSALYGIVGEIDDSEEVKIEINTKVPTGKSNPFSSYSWRIVDDVEEGIGAISVKFNETATVDTKVFIDLIRTRTNTSVHTHTAS